MFFEPRGERASQYDQRLLHAVGSDGDGCVIRACPMRGHHGEKFISDSGETFFATVAVRRSIAHDATARVEARDAIHARISLSFHARACSLNLSGAGNSPARTLRHSVVRESGTSSLICASRSSWSEPRTFETTTVCAVALTWRDLHLRFIEDLRVSEKVFAGT